jgi:hypothetical protein
LAYRYEKQGKVGSYHNKLLKCHFPTQLPFSEDAMPPYKLIAWKIVDRKDAHA